jgi:multimeric flavodoxin WrbA
VARRIRVFGWEKMKILGFNASPRKEGNTAWVIDKILEGAEERGAEIQTWHFSDLDLKPCQGCLGCVRSDKCVIADDMHKLYAALKESDVLVLGSPVYMGQMTAQAKIFIDRLFAQITPRFSPRFKEENVGKKLILAFTQGNPDADRFQAYFDYTKNMFQLLEFDVRGVYVVAGTRNEQAREKKDLPAAMKKIGSALVS